MHVLLRMFYGMMWLWYGSGVVWEWEWGLLAGRDLHLLLVASHSSSAARAVLAPGHWEVLSRHGLASGHVLVFLCAATTPSVQSVIESLTEAKPSSSTALVVATQAKAQASAAAAGLSALALTRRSDTKVRCCHRVAAAGVWRAHTHTHTPH